MEDKEKDLNSFFENLIADGRKSYNDCSEQEILKLSGLLLKCSKDPYEVLIDEDCQVNYLPHAIWEHLINPCAASLINIQATIQATGKRMYKDKIDQMFSDYKYTLTDEQILENAQREHDAYGEL